MIITEKETKDLNKIVEDLVGEELKELKKEYNRQDLEEYIEDAIEELQNEIFSALFVFTICPTTLVILFWVWNVLDKLFWPAVFIFYFTSFFIALAIISGNKVEIKYLRTVLEKEKERKGGMKNDRA